MGSKDLSTSVSFAKDVINNVVARLDGFADTALSRLEKSTGMKFRKDRRIHLAGGPGFCMEIRRYDKPAEIAEVSDAVPALQIEEKTAYGEIQPAVEEISTVKISAIEEIAEVPSVEEPAVIGASDAIAEEDVSDVVCVADDEVSHFVSDSEDTVADDDFSIVSVPMEFAEAATSSCAAEQPTFSHEFTVEEPVTEAVGEPVDDGVDYDDLYKTIAATIIYNDVMPALVPEVFEESSECEEIPDSVISEFEEPYVPEYVISEFGESTVEETTIEVSVKYVPEYVITEFGEPVTEETVIEVPVKYVPEYVITEFGEPVTEETVIEVPVKYVPEYVITEIAEPVSEEISTEIPGKIQETAVTPFTDSVTTTATFRFSFAATSTPGKTGFSFRMGKKKSIEEFISGPEQPVSRGSNADSAVLAESRDGSGMTLN